MKQHMIAVFVNYNKIKMITNLFCLFKMMNFIYFACQKLERLLKKSSIFSYFCSKNQKPNKNNVFPVILLRFLGVIILLLNLSGCETTKKLYKVITDPNVPVGYPSDKASELELSFLADPDINANLGGEPTPIDIQVVYLTEDSKILSLDYYQIDPESLNSALGKSYIDHQDYTLEPKQYKVLNPLAIDAKAQYLAIIAHYAAAASGEVYWLDTTELKSVGQKYKMLIHIRADEVEIKKP